MKTDHVRIASVLILLCCSVFGQAQQTVATGTNVVVPTLVSFSGVLANSNGKPLTSITGVTFFLYAEQEGGTPLWLETQNVQPDKNGNYSVMLGSTTSQGLPSSLFVSGQARWLEVQAQGQDPQPRIMLLSVPYALKAGDAQTLGGKPASAFAAASAGNSAGPNGVVNNAITGGGTTDYVPLWLSKSKLGSSKIFQDKTGDLGVGTTTPAANLDVNGTSDIRDTLTLFPNGSAPTLSVSGTAFEVSNTGTVTFVSGQTFPGTGTITGVTAGSGLSGGGSSGKVTLSVPSAGITNAMLAKSSLTVNPGGGMTGGGKISLGGSATLGLENCSANQVLEFISGAWTCATAGTGTITGVTAGTDLTGGGSSGNVTLNVNTTALNSTYAQLGAANTFTGTQTINNTVTVTAAGTTLTASGGSTGVSGSGTVAGLQGSSSSGTGVYGSTASATAAGVYGNNSSGYGVYGSGNYGVVGLSTICCGTGGSFTGFSGSGYVGTAGVAAFGGAGDEGIGGGDGVDAYGGNNNSGGGNGVTGQGGGGALDYGADGVFKGGSSAGLYGDGVDGNAGSGYAGNFTGDVNVTGTLTAGTKHFKIDHPLDPANKYLVHASVESSEMMNIYTGNLITDAQGYATVQLPEWFEALNTDFRYQLTVIGQFAQAIVARKIENHQFQIRTSAPNVELSWQVTGVRQDAYAKAHPLVVEEEKEARLKGFYIHPELYGAPPEKQIEWARHPQMMKKMQQVRQTQQQHRQAAVTPPAPVARTVAAK